MLGLNRDRILTLVAAIGCFTVTYLLIEVGFSLWMHEAREQTQLMAFDSAKTLERNIDRSLAGAKVLGTYIEVSRGQTGDFEAIADSILRNLRGISNLQLAPDGVIARIHPLAGNEKAIGHDLLKDDKRRAEAHLAIKTRRLTLAGPFELVQGGVAIIGRQPVFIDNRFWGFTSALILMEQVMEMSQLRERVAGNYDFTLWRHHPDSGERHVIAGDPSLDDEVSTRSAINVPNSTWYLDVAYIQPPLLDRFYFAALALNLLLSVIVGHWAYGLVSRPRLLERQVREKTVELQQANTQLKHEQSQLRLFRNAVDQSGNVIIVADKKGVIEYVNPRFSEVTGYRSDEVIGQPPRVIKSEFTSLRENEDLWQKLLAGEIWRGERRNRRKDGSYYWSLLHIAPIRDESGEINHYVSVSDDITDSKENQMLIEKLAYHDSLTGLANRRYFIDRLEQVVRYGERHERCAAVLFLDLDRFKAVNDTYGHPVGDGLLIEVARRLMHITRKSDLCARLGGDEFTVLLTEVDCVQGVYAVAEKIIGSLREPILIDGHSCDISTSIGISLIEQQQPSAGQVLRQADMALYMAKSAGRDQYRVYQAESSLQADGKAGSAAPGDG